MTESNRPVVMFNIPFGGDIPAIFIGVKQQNLNNTLIPVRRFKGFLASMVYLPTIARARDGLDKSARKNWLQPTPMLTYL